MNDTRISLPTYGIELGDHYRKAFSRAIEGTLIKKLASQDGRWPAVAMSASIRYEMLEDGPVPQGSMDYSAEVNLGKRLGKNFIYASLGYTYFDTSHFFSMPLKDTQRTGMLSYERHVGKNSALVVQYLYGEGVAIDLGELSDASHEIIFGYKWLQDKVLWEFALTENIINLNNSPDFGLTAGFLISFLMARYRPASFTPDIGAFKISLHLVPKQRWLLGQTGIGGIRCAIPPSACCESLRIRNRDPTFGRDWDRCLHLLKRIGPWGKRICPRTEGSSIVFPCIRGIPKLETGRPEVALVEVPFLEAMMQKAVVVETRILEAAILEPVILEALVSKTTAVDEPRSAHVFLHAVQSRAQTRTEGAPMESVPTLENPYRVVIARKSGTGKNREMIASGACLGYRRQQHGADSTCSKLGDRVPHGGLGKGDRFIFAICAAPKLDSPVRSDEDDIQVVF